MADLSTDVRYIKGVGEAKAKALGKLGIATLGDLIGWFPRRYDDRRESKPISQLVPGEAACVDAMIASEPRLTHVRRGMDLVKVRAVDETGALDITFFNQSWLKNQLQVGETYIFYGRAEGTLLRKTMASPIVEPEGRRENTGRIVPVYPLTAGVSQLLLSRAIRQGLDACADILRTACRTMCARPTSSAGSTTPMRISTSRSPRRLWTLPGGGWLLRSCFSLPSA